MTDDVAALEAQVHEQLDVLLQFRDSTMRTMRALFVDDAEALERTMGVLRGTVTGEAIDLREAVDRCIAERDLARAAAVRFEQHGETYIAAVIRGQA